MVVSDLIANQLGWRDGEDYLVGGDRKEFAASCCLLHSDQQLWETLRANALARAGAELRQQAFAEALSAVFNKLSMLSAPKLQLPVTG